MTPADAIRLLALCATYDNRKPDTSGMAAHAWADALMGLEFDECKQAVVRHYRDTDRYIMPAHIRQQVERIREFHAAARRVSEGPPSIADAPRGVPMPDFVKQKLDEIAQRRQCEHGCLEQPVEDAS